MEGKENIQPVINFIDSMEDNYEKKQKNMKEKIGNNEKWLKEWTKRKNIFNKCFYDEANEKVESVMQEINEKECTEAEIDEMIERIDCFNNTKNDIPANVNFQMGKLAIILSIISAMFSALLTYLIQKIDEIIKLMPKVNMLNIENLKNIAVFLLCILNIAVAVTPAIFTVVIVCKFLHMSKTIQLLMYRWETLNLLKIRLNKLKKEKFGQ